MSEQPKGWMSQNLEPTRTGLSAEALQRAVLDNLMYLQARFPQIATPHDWYMALAYTVRDRLLARWVSTVQIYAAQDVKVACYLSAEFLMGPQLGNNLINLGIEAAAREAMRALGQDLDALLTVGRRARPWATGASDGWRRATWIPSRPWRSRRSATASATSSASSTRRSTTAGRSRSRTSGCRRAMRGRSSAPMWCTT
jgi:hypothetical protein